MPAIIILRPADTAALERIHAALAHYDIAIFVSANAVEYGVPDPRRWPARLQAFAPGPGTAAALVAVGIAAGVLAAFLVGIDRPNQQWSLESSLAELERLADTAGAETVAITTQRSPLAPP